MYLARIKALVGHPALERLAGRERRHPRHEPDALAAGESHQRAAVANHTLSTGPRLAGVRGARRVIARTIAAGKLLARDDRIPKPVRWMVLLGLLPLPGPLDEAILLCAAPLLFVFGREPMREAWRRSQTEAR